MSMQNRAKEVMCRWTIIGSTVFALLLYCCIVVCCKTKFLSSFLSVISVSQLDHVILDQIHLERLGCESQYMLVVKV